MRDVVDYARRFLINRAGAYKRTFSPSSDADIVLSDLAKFCRAHTSTGHENAMIASRLDGRREVWLRIQQHINLDNETLWNLYDGRKGN